ncbi:MAG: hypothetical protein K8U03_21175 [Planctomycetia bacterium]|nr:hypothetical protein [Planctomycetia bacterium]
MNPLMDRYTAFVTRQSLVSRCALVIGVVAVVLAIAAPIAYGEHGAVGAQATFLAAAVCLCGTISAVILASIHSVTPNAVGWILAGDGIAMALPLTTVTLVSQRGGPLAEAGLLNWIVLFFLVSLTTKTLLIAPLAQLAKRAATATTTKVGA